MPNENRHSRHVRRHARTEGHICVSFNSLASWRALIVARDELLAACDRAQLLWALRLPPDPSRSQDAHTPSVALQPLLVLVPCYQQQHPMFEPFESQYLTRAAR